MRTEHTQGEIASMRMKYRAAEIRGHSAGCAVAWDGRQCSCPGRAAIHGRTKAAEIEQRQDNMRTYLVAVDLKARFWMASRED